MQCTAAAYGQINQEYVYKVCDEPHPNKINEMFAHCMNGETRDAFDIVQELLDLGYSVEDLVGIMFRNAVRLFLKHFEGN
jgi:replication factor C subunit 2/4